MKKQERPFVVKTLLKCLALLAFALPLAFASCSSSSDGGDDWDWDDEDFDEDYMEVCEHVAKAANQISDIYAECKSIGELAEFEEEIRDIRYVEDVWFSNNTMFVEIKDYGPIMYEFFPKEENENSEPEAEMIRHYSATRADNPSHPLLGLETAVVINQLYKDEDREKERNISELIIRMLSGCDIKCTPNNAPTIDFFENGIFAYDIIFLTTHGSWDNKRQVHWFLTSEEPKETSTLTPGEFYKHKDYPRDQVVWASHKEKRNGEEKRVWNARISEKLVEASQKKFKKFGKVIFFNVACQSLMGKTNYWEDNNNRNFSFAEILKEKGVGAYFGYDESNSVGARAGLLFFGKLASGMSIKNAYETLPTECLHNKQSEVRGNTLFPWDVDYVADLLSYYSEYNPQISSSRITGPVLNGYQDNSTSEDLVVELQAESPLYPDFLINYPSNAIDHYKYYFKYDSFRYGFEYSKTEDFTNTVLTTGKKVGSSGCSLSPSYNSVSFSQKLFGGNLTPATTYYYRAFFYDGRDYYYSEPSSFTTKNIPVDTETHLPDVPGTDF